MPGSSYRLVAFVYYRESETGIKFLRVSRKKLRCVRSARLVRILAGSFLYTWRGQVWVRVFRSRCRSLDVGPGGTDSLLNFLLSRCQRIVRDVQRALLDFGFDYAVQRCDRVGYFLLVSRISQFLDFNSSCHGFAQTRIAWISFVLHALRFAHAGGAFAKASCTTLSVGMSEISTHTTLRSCQNTMVTPLTS